MVAMYFCEFSRRMPTLSPFSRSCRTAAIRLASSANSAKVHPLFSSIKAMLAALDAATRSKTSGKYSIRNSLVQEMNWGVYHPQAGACGRDRLPFAAGPSTSKTARAKPRNGETASAISSKDRIQLLLLFARQQLLQFAYKVVPLRGQFALGRMKSDCGIPNIRRI